MKKLFQRQKPDYNPIIGAPFGSTIPTVYATQRLIRLAPSNGVVSDTQPPPTLSEIFHRSRKRRDEEGWAGALQQKGSFFSRDNNLPSQDVSLGPGPRYGNNSKRDEENQAGSPGELTRMIGTRNVGYWHIQRSCTDEVSSIVGYVTDFAADDWNVVLEICDRAAASEANAREAAAALRREFK